MAWYDFILGGGTTKATAESTGKVTKKAGTKDAPTLPDYTDQIIKAIQQSQRPQTGRTRQASFGEMPFFGGLL